MKLSRSHAPVPSRAVFAAALLLFGCVGGDSPPGPSDDVASDASVDTSPDGVVDAVPDAEPDADAEPETVADAEPETVSDADAGAETVADAEPETIPDADAEPETVADADADAEPETVMDAEPETVVDADAEPVEDADAKPETVTDAEPELGPDVPPGACDDYPASGLESDPVLVEDFEAGPQGATIASPWTVDGEVTYSAAVNHSTDGTYSAAILAPENTGGGMPDLDGLMRSVSGGPEITLSAWVRAQGGAGGSEIGLLFGSTGKVSVGFSPMESNSWVLRVGQGVAPAATLSGPSPNNWVRVVVRYCGGKIYAWVDGQAFDATPSFTGNPNGVSLMSLPGPPEGNAYLHIDDVVVW